MTTRNCPPRVELTVIPVPGSSSRSSHTALPHDSTPTRLTVRLLTAASRSSSRNVSASVKSETGPPPSMNCTLDTDGSSTMSLSLTSSTVTSTTADDDMDGEPRSLTVTINSCSWTSSAFTEDTRNIEPL